MLSDVLSYMNTTFTLFFTIECSLKLISFGGRVTANYGAILCFICFVPVLHVGYVLWSDKFLVIVCCHCSFNYTSRSQAPKDTKCQHYFYVNLRQFILLYRVITKRVSRFTSRTRTMITLYVLFQTTFIAQRQLFCQLCLLV